MYKRQAKAKGLITEAVFEGFKEKYSKQLMALMGANEQMNVNPMRTNKSQKPVDSVIQTALETADSTFPDLYGNVFMEAKIRPSQLNILTDQHLTMIGIPLGDALIMIDSFGSSQS